MNTLYAGPWVGEFGWELMGWQSHVREAARNYDKVVIGCDRASRAMYQGMPCEVEFLDVKRSIETSGSRAYKDKAGSSVRALFRHHKHNWMRGTCRMPGGKWIKFGGLWSGRGPVSPYFVIHARNTPKFQLGGSSLGRNWPTAHWDELMTMIYGPPAIAIGTIKEAYCPVGAIDMRGVVLQKVMDILACAQFIVGPQSGPIHLAALCGCPFVAWTCPTKGAMGMKNVARLKKHWNPFNVPCDILADAGWQPTVDVVCTAVGKAISERNPDAVAVDDRPNPVVTRENE